MHLRDFSWSVTGYEYWLDPFSCNSTSTKVWIRAKSMEANERTSLRLYTVSSLKKLPDKSLDGANIFDYFEEPKSPNPQNIYYRNLDSNKAKCLQDPNIWQASNFIFGFVSNLNGLMLLKLPYLSQWNRPTISVANSSVMRNSIFQPLDFWSMCAKARPKETIIWG